jgi:hypothetical protein
MHLPALIATMTAATLAITPHAPPFATALWLGGARVCHRYTAGQDFTHHTRISAVSHKTHGIVLTRGILVIKLLLLFHYIIKKCIWRR